MGGCWGRCGDADACVLFIFDLLTRAADQKESRTKHETEETGNRRRMSNLNIVVLRLVALHISVLHCQVATATNFMARLLQCLVAKHRCPLQRR